MFTYKNKNFRHNGRQAGLYMALNGLFKQAYPLSFILSIPDSSIFIQGPAGVKPRHCGLSGYLPAILWYRVHQYQEFGMMSGEKMTWENALPASRHLGPRGAAAPERRNQGAAKVPSKVRAARSGTAYRPGRHIPRRNERFGSVPARAGRAWCLGENGSTEMLIKNGSEALLFSLEFEGGGQLGRLNATSHPNFPQATGHGTTRAPSRLGTSLHTWETPMDQQRRLAPAGGVMETVNLQRVFLDPSAPTAAARCPRPPPARSADLVGNKSNY